MNLLFPGLHRRVGPYEVLRPLARGGHAEVWEVLDPHTGEHLALKRLTALSPSSIARFTREYAVMNALDHPNLVRVFRFGRTDGVPWIVMELVEGTPIQAFARDQGRPGTARRTEEVVRLAAELCAGLAHLHARGIVHRDLKSANILILPDGRLKLLDFGTARDAAGEAITANGEFLGTFAYASPEQLQGGLADARSDLYSFGVLLYRLLTGKRPYEAREPQALARQHLYDVPVNPRVLVPELSDPLAALVLSCLEKSPEKRPQSANEVAAALAALTGGPLETLPMLELSPRANRTIGREAQLIAVRDFFDRGEEGGALAIVGEPGAGRRVLRQAALGWIEEGPFRPLCLAFGAGGDAAELAKVLGHSPDLDAAELADRLAEALSDLTLDAGRPVVLFLTDLHLAAPATRTALAKARCALVAESVHCLLCMDFEGAAESASPAWLQEFGAVEEVRLPPLDAGQVALLVGTLLHRRPPPAAVAEWIWRASAGRPEWVEEVVAGLVERGGLHASGPHGGHIEWSPDRDWEVPLAEGARAGVRRAVEALPVAHRRALEALAVLAGPATASLWAVLLDQGVAELEPVLAALRASGWLTARDREIDFTVTGVGAAVDALTPAARRAALIRRLHASVDALPASPLRVRVLAELGRVAEARRLGAGLAGSAIGAGRPLDALRLVEPLLAGTAAETAPDPDLAQLWLAHTTALLLTRPRDPAAGRALVRARQCADPASRLDTARLALARARLQRALGHEPSFRRHLMEAWAAVDPETSPDLASKIAEMQGVAARLGGDLAEAERWHERALALPVADTKRRVGAQSAWAALRLERGELGEAEAGAREALAAADRVGDPRGRSHALCALIEALRLQGRVSEALRLGWDGVVALRACQAPTWYFRLLIHVGACEAALGRLGRARELVDELSVNLRKGEHLHLRLDARLLAIRLLLDARECAAAEEQALDLVRRAEEPGLVVHAARGRALLGEARWRAGAAAEGATRFDAALQTLAEIGAYPALHDAVCARVLLPKGASSLAALQAFPDAPRPWVTLAQARADGGSEAIEGALHALTAHLSADDALALAVLLKRVPGA